MFWLGAAVSLCYIPGLTGAYIATQWPLLSLLLPFGLWRSGPFTVFHAVGLLFIAYAALRMPYSPTIDGSVYGMWLLVISGLAVWFGTTLTSTKELYAGLAVGAVVSSLVAVFQYFGVPVVPSSTLTPAGIYVNSVQQGTVLALVVVALATERMWLWTLPLLPGIALSHSRGGLIVLAMGLLGCYVRRLWVFGALLAAGAFFLLSPLSASDTQRVFLWHSAWDNLTWLGWGTGVFYNVLLSQDGAPSFFPEYVHNDFLQIIFEYGIGAACPFALLGYSLWRSDVKEWPIVAAFCAAACFSMPFFMPVAAFLAFVAMGCIFREHGLAVGNGYGRRFAFLSRQTGGSREAVPVASHFAAEG